MKKLLVLLLLLFIVNTLSIAQSSEDLYRAGGNLNSDEITIDKIKEIKAICDYFIENSNDNTLIESAKIIKNRAIMNEYVLNGAKSLSDLPEDILSSNIASLATVLFVKNDYSNSEAYLKDYVNKYGIEPKFRIDSIAVSIQNSYIKNKKYEEGLSVTEKLIKEYPFLSDSEDININKAELYFGLGNKNKTRSIFDSLMSNLTDYKDKVRYLQILSGFYIMDNMNEKKKENIEETKAIYNEIKLIGISENDESLIKEADERLAYYNDNYNEKSLQYETNQNDDSKNK